MAAFEDLRQSTPLRHAEREGLKDWICKGFDRRDKRCQCGRAALEPGAVEVSEPDVDLREAGRALACRAGEQHRGQGVAPQVRVAVLDEPGA
jgi:hypothetical protein